MVWDDIRGREGVGCGFWWQGGATGVVLGMGSDVRGSLSITDYLHDFFHLHAHAKAKGCLTSLVLTSFQDQE